MVDLATGGVERSEYGGCAIPFAVMGPGLMQNFIVLLVSPVARKGEGTPDSSRFFGE
jgi:hypothetical protein